MARYEDGHTIGFNDEMSWYAEPEPYVQQTKPSLPARVIVFTVLRRSRCQAHWWCSWPATEQGGTCDPHDPHLAAYIGGTR